jgi:type IV pilus assembly protein PilY1
MDTTMKKILSKLAAPVAALALAVLPAAAFAAATNIAQVPLLNISGTGTVKPNLMLLFDNSGSMEQTYTPDYINDNICRTRATLAQGVTGCNVGHPPFMSPDFNRQYYNPAIRYQPPVYWDGTSYPTQNSSNTSSWTNVVSDGFNKQNRDLYGASDTAINLTNGFPDLKWCDPNDSSSCKTNTSYSYPDNTFYSASKITTQPYYYQIVVSEYCTDDSLTKCQSVAIGGGAPAGYPVPAKLRWCNSTALTSCQGKHVGNYIYPKYSTPAGALVAYGTLTIGQSYGSSALSVSSVSVTDPITNTSRIITTGAVSAPTGTDIASKQQTLATAIAANIIGNTSLGADAYWACVKTPISGYGVPACSTFGLTLSADNVVAVLPINCPGSTKNMASCSTINDSLNNPRAGWTLSAATPSITPGSSSSNRATAIIQVTAGKASSNDTVNGVKLGSATVGGSFAIRKSSPSTDYNDLVGLIINAIGTSNAVKAYQGGSSATPRCAQEPTTSVCIVDTGSTSSGAAPSFSNSPGGLSGFTINYVNAIPAQDFVPITTIPLSNGASAPSAFVRTNIVSGQTYTKGLNRSDCVAQAGVCTYNEEMTNFANWYSYYKTRLQMMKTSVGIAFAAVTGNYRVGYVNLSVAGAAGAVDMKPADFTGTNRTTWYQKLYDTTTSGSTPTRTAMDNVGRMFANLSPYNYAAGQEVVQFPCQQNFMILTTDGYWNGSSTNNVVNNDNVENTSRFCTKARGCVDTRTQTQPSISDVALHWYNGGSSTGTVSLRPGLEPDMTKPGQVPAGAGENSHLHVNTFTLGLGMDGVMTYDQNYDTSPKANGDFYNLITGVTTGCPWNGGGAYVWPDPDTTNTGSTVQERVDDLWHAAVNGHGRYFSANQPKEVVDGLSAALAKMQISPGAAAAAATSTPNITQQDNDIFSDTFTTVKWYGELTARKLDPTTGDVGTTPTWTSSNVVGLKVGSNSDTRNIYTVDDAGTVIPFKYASMSAMMKGWFDNKCGALAQCTLLGTADRAIVNSGDNLVNWLRGQQQYSDDTRFRAYTMTSNTPSGASGPIPIVLGDIASSKPAYVRDPRKNYPDATYQAFKAAKASRKPVVYTAANDGMLHAFDAATGEELMAYVPRITMKKLWQLASTTYGTNHIFTADGSPEVADVQIGTAWRTMLVAGLNGGGRGYYALDVTDEPTATSKPVVKWELCADPAICANSDPDIGLTFGNAQYGMWQGKWVVFITSGYNNIPGVDGVNTGNGQGYLFIVDVSNGKILKKVGTGSGDAATPSGFAKITAITEDPNTDPVVTYVYGGDNLGQMWRFDLTDTSTTNVGLLKMGDAGTSQPITARPDVTLCAVKQPNGSLQAQRVVLFGTGRLLDVPDTTNNAVQSLYLVKDSGANINIRGSGMVEQVLSSSGSNTQVFTSTNKPVDLRTQNGWYFDWKLTPGERMNLDPQIVNGVAGVVTNIPSSSSACTVGGTSNLYALDVCNGNGVNDNVVGGTLSNTSAAVGYIIIRLPGGQKKIITTTAKGDMLKNDFPDGDTDPAHPVGWRRVKGD